MRYSVAVGAMLMAASLWLADHPMPAHGEGIVIAQSVEQTRAVDLAMVEQLPPVNPHVSFLTDHGPEEATYWGALLWTVLEQVDTLGSDPRARLRHTVAVTGRDGYVATPALAKIAPEFEAKQVLLAYRRNGQMMAGNAMRLVVPGDRRGGRSVRDVARIDLR